MLPRAAANQLAVLSSLLPSAWKAEYGRSYDGRDWEGVMPTPLVFDCSYEEGCSTVLPQESRTGGGFTVEFYSKPPLAPDKAAARFLQQSTFGQTAGGVRELAELQEGDESF